LIRSFSVRVLLVQTPCARNTWKPMALVALESSFSGIPNMCIYWLLGRGWAPLKSRHLGRCLGLTEQTHANNAAVGPKHLGRGSRARMHSSKVKWVMDREQILSSLRAYRSRPGNRTKFGAIAPPSMNEGVSRGACQQPHDAHGHHGTC